MSSASIANPRPDTPPLQLLLIDLGAACYGVESALVREIVPVHAVTRLPGAPEHVVGVMNLRGQLVTIIDLTRRMRGASATRGERSIVIVQTGERLLGLVVDDVHDVQAIELAGVEDLSLEHSAPDILRGVGRLRDGVVLVIDVDELVRQTLA
jgi:purine-binding chemotaxis protein CheW